MFRESCVCILFHTHFPFILLILLQFFAFQSSLSLIFLFLFYPSPFSPSIKPLYPLVYHQIRFPSILYTYFPPLISHSFSHLFLPYLIILLLSILFLLRNISISSFFVLLLLLYLQLIQTYTYIYLLYTHTTTYLTYTNSHTMLFTRRHNFYHNSFTNYLAVFHLFSLSDCSLPLCQRFNAKQMHAKMSGVK